MVDTKVWLLRSYASSILSYRVNLWTSIKTTTNNKLYPPSVQKTDHLSRFHMYRVFQRKYARLTKYNFKVAYSSKNTLSTSYNQTNSDRWNKNFGKIYFKYIFQNIKRGLNMTIFTGQSLKSTHRRSNTIFFGTASLLCTLDNIDSSRNSKNRLTWWWRTSRVLSFQTHINATLRPTCYH